MSRGQAHTLEGTIAGLLLLVSLLVTLQTTAVTPLTASTSSQHIENQMANNARGALSAAEADGELKPAVLYWDEANARFHNTGTRGFYTNEPPNNAFGEILNVTFDSRGIAYNVYLNYNGTEGREPYIDRGEPSDNAVSVSRTVTLLDSDRLRTDTGRPGTKVSDVTNFYASDKGNNVYNVVTVEVVVWRI